MRLLPVYRDSPEWWSGILLHTVGLSDFHVELAHHQSLTRWTGLNALVNWTRVRGSL